MSYKIVIALLLFGLSVVAQMNPNAGVLDPAQLPVLDQNKVANLTSDLAGKQAAGVYMTGATSPLGVSGTNVTCPNASDSVSGCLTATDHATFDGKQAALGFTPENVANKAPSTSLGTSDTAYPSQNAVKIYVDTGLASKANATASTTVNGQTCALGSSCTVADSTKVPTTTTVNGHALSSNVTVTASDVALGNVTNDVQTKAAIVPNTAPSATQIMIGNSGGTAYAPQTLSGPVSITAAGVTSVATLNQNTTGTQAA